MATTVVSRQDSDGYTHQICSQSQMNTCAAASLFMIQCIKEKRTAAGGEDQIHKWAGRSNSTWASGLDYDVLWNILNSFAPVPYWEQADDPQTKGVSISNGYCYNEHPALAIVYWYNAKGEAAGAHAVIAPWFTDDKSKVVFLDPWKGQLVELVNDGNFVSKSGKGKIGLVYYT